MYRKSALFLITIIIIFSCNRKKETGLTTISGHFPKFTGQLIYLEELNVSNALIIDSVEISKDGTFDFKMNQEDAGFYILTTDNENYVILQIEKNEKVKIKADDDPFLGKYQVKGSPGSKLVMNFELFMKKQKQRVDSLAEVYFSIKGDPDFSKIKIELDSVYEVIFSRQKAYVKNFIEKNPSSLASLIVLNRKLGNNNVLDEESDYKYFRKLDSALMLKYHKNRHVIDHHKRTEKIKADIYDKFMADRKLKPGNKAPNIVMKDTSGEFISLRDLAGQKVLIYFWAGWNAKSRQDNRKLIGNYGKLKSRNIEIFGVSLDEHEKVWRGAIEVDKLPWIQGSDLMGKKSPANEKYNLNGELPFYYFVDVDSKIIFREKDVEKVIEKLKGDE
ncbi:MAG: redoxin domain-containing protein [Bacteroidales bacterium]|nr:redoxin domain-containing protein [Bacteroidales bacterium]